MRFGTQIAIVVAGTTLVAVTMSAWLTYHASTAIIAEGAMHSVGVVAEAREMALRLRLHHQTDRAANFLSALRDECGATVATPRCLRESLERFASIEGANAALLESSNGTVLVGERAAELRSIAPERERQLAVMTACGAGKCYVVQASGAIGSVFLRFPGDLLDLIFRDREGLGTSGETFLSDANGFFVTTARYPHRAGHSHPIDTGPMRLCLSGRDGEIVAPDYRGVLVVHGYRYVPEIGGGCIMAHIDQAEAFAPARHLARRIALAAAAFGVIVILCSFLLGSLVSRSLKKIATAAEAFGRGDFSQPVPITGPTEIRELGRSVSTAARLLQADADARKVEEDFQRLVIGVLGHDLRNPLNAISGTVVQLSADALDARQTRAVARIRSSSDRMARMVRDLLDVTRGRAGGMPIEPREANLDELARDVVEEIRIAHPDREVRLTAELECRGECDPDRVKQVISNLVGNAARYGRADAPIDVVVRRDGEQVVISVHNEGEPIPAADIPILFEPYRRGRREVSSSDGLGLGLYIVREIVRAHHGAIDVRSSAAEGTTFEVRFPTTQAAASAG